MPLTATRDLVTAVWELAREPLPAAVRGHTELLMLNGLGVAIAASDEGPAEAVVRLGGQFGGAAVAPVAGRRELLDPFYSAMANATAMQTDDFDDTHLETVIHPTSTSLAAGLAAGVVARTSGQRLVTSVALGCEVALRIGAAMPGHYEKGWHITSTCGVLGAATTAGLCLDLDQRGLHQALAIAASQTVGHRSSFGTDVKPLQAGKAAANGLLAALLARDGFTGPARPLEGPRGFFRVMAPRGADLDRLTRDIGQDWELLRTTVKPYPCGVVTHPAIDAAEQLARSGRIDRSSIATVEVLCHPLVPELTGIARPVTGLQARFSTAHAVACALLTGRLDQKSYDESMIDDPDVVRLREAVVLRPSPERARESAAVIVHTRDGEAVRQDVATCRGSLGNPLSESEVRDKVRRLVERKMGGRSECLLSAVADLQTAPTLDVLAGAVGLAR